MYDTVHMAGPKLPPLPPFKNQRSDALDFKICETCGQRFDTRDLEQVFHHGPEPHNALHEDKP